MKREWIVIANDSIVFRGSKIACRMFCKDNTYIYPNTRIKLSRFNGCKLI